MKALLLMVILTPKAPEVCLPYPNLDSYLCPDNIHYVFTERAGCGEPVVVFEACAVMAEDDDLAPPPDVDPDFDEHSPTGPGPGPEGAPTVDRPDVPKP
jgi:hypothetical protein